MMYGSGCDPFLKGEDPSLQHKVGKIHSEGFPTLIIWRILLRV